MKIKLWETKQLDEVATFSSGGTPSKEESNYWEGDYPWVSAKDMKSFSIKDAGLKLTPEGLAMARIAKKGSVLVLVRGMTLLKDLPVGYVERDVAFNQDIKALVAKNGVSGLFLAYALIANKNRILNLVNVAGHGTGRLDTTLLKEFPIDFPPLLEQCRIAEMLGVWDESIDLLERLIGRVRSRKQGLMQQLLTGKRRFKEFEGSEWKIKKLKDIGKVVSGGTPETNNPEYWNGNIPWCTPSEITALKDRYIKFTGRTISEEGIKSSSTAIIPANSLLVCTRATIGYSAINIVPMCTNQGFKNVIPNKLISVEFLYYKLCLEKHQLLRLASGSTFLEISKKDFEIIEISIPSLPEQEKIAAVLSAADEEISTLEKQLAAYKQQKLGLMQQLLTGKIRVGMN
jgi:type I restriction enzyme, S subunit